MPSSYALRHTFTAKKALINFGVEHKMALHETFSLYEINPYSSEMFIDYVMKAGKGGGNALCYGLIKIVKKLSFWKGAGGSFEPNEFYVIHEWPIKGFCRVG